MIILLNHSLLSLLILSVSRALQSWTHVTFLTTYQEDEETWHDEQKDEYKYKKDKDVHTYKEKDIKA